MLRLAFARCEVLVYCFTTALLLLYYCFTAAFVQCLQVVYVGLARGEVLAYCFLLLLYYCFTTVPADGVSRFCTWRGARCPLL